MDIHVHDIMSKKLLHTQIPLCASLYIKLFPFLIGFIYFLLHMTIYHICIFDMYIYYI